jgi:hypothetical protein
MNMSDLINQLKGPYFSFLVANKDEYWERRGRVQRITGIKAEYFHHPEALKVPDCLISLVVTAFGKAHPKFSYYGDTVYKTETLNQLIGELQFQAERIVCCQTRQEFGSLLTELFVSYCQDSIGNWRRHWPTIRQDVHKAINTIISVAEQARQENRGLLVLGV